MTHTISTELVKQWVEDLIAASATFSRTADAAKVQHIAYRMETVVRMANGELRPL